MKAEKLVTLASPHGVDLLAAARKSTKPTKRDTLKRTRRGITSTHLLPPAWNRARGCPDRSVLRPEWTIAELGQAGQGVPEIPFMAACYAFAGEQGNYWRLHQALCHRGAHLAQQYRWPATVKDLHGIQVQFLAHLAVLLLDWDANPHPFRASPGLYAIVMRVTQPVWEKQLQGPFEDLHLVWMDWLREAARRIQSRLGGLEEFQEWAGT